MQYEIPHRNRNCAPWNEDRLREPHTGPRLLFRGTHRRTAGTGKIPRHGQSFRHSVQPALHRRRAAQLRRGESRTTFGTGIRRRIVVPLRIPRLFFRPGSGPSPRGDERRPKKRSRSAARCRPNHADLRHGVGLRTRRRGGRQLPPPARRGVHAAQAGRGRDRHRFRRPHGRSARRQGGDPYGQPRAASRRLTGGQRREQSRAPSGRRRAGGTFSRRTLFPRIRNSQRRPARLPVLRRRSGASGSAGRGIRLGEVLGGGSLGAGPASAARRPPYRRGRGAPAPQPAERNLPRVLPPQARRDRGAAADRFSDRSGIFPPMYRNKFVHLRSIIRIP